MEELARENERLRARVRELESALWAVLGQTQRVLVDLHAPEVPPVAVAVHEARPVGPQERVTGTQHGELASLEETVRSREGRAPPDCGCSHVHEREEADAGEYGAALSSKRHKPSSEFGAALLALPAPDAAVSPKPTHAFEQQQQQRFLQPSSEEQDTSSLAAPAPTDFAARAHSACDLPASRFAARRAASARCPPRGRPHRTVRFRTPPRPLAAFDEGELEGSGSIDPEAEPDVMQPASAPSDESPLPPPTLSSSSSSGAAAAQPQAPPPPSPAPADPLSDFDTDDLLFEDAPLRKYSSLELKMPHLFRHDPSYAPAGSGHGSGPCPRPPDDGRALFDPSRDCGVCLLERSPMPEGDAEYEAPCCRSLFHFSCVAKVIGMRAIRKTCPQCARPFEPEECARITRLAIERRREAREARRRAIAPRPSSAHR
eukprot:tig00021094_g18107.t1